MNKKIIFLIFVFAVLLIAGIYLSKNQDQEIGQKTDQPLGGGIKNQEVISGVTVTRIQSGYTPDKITIKKGGTVTWLNESGDFHWPASDIHPTHRIYPDFDPKEPIGPGETWSFTFEQTGEWRYHDHLRANFRGTIIVEE